LCAFI